MNFFTKFFLLVLFLTSCQFDQSAAMNDSLGKIVVIQMQSFLKYAHDKMTSEESEVIQVSDFIDILKRDLGNLIVASFNASEMVFNTEFNGDIDRSYIKKAMNLFLLSQVVLNSNAPDAEVYPSKIKLNEMVAEIAISLCNDLDKHCVDSSNKPGYIFVGSNLKNRIMSANSFRLQTKNV